MPSDWRVLTSCHGLSHHACVPLYDGAVVAGALMISCGAPNACSPKQREELLPLLDSVLDHVQLRLLGQYLSLAVFSGAPGRSVPQLTIEALKGIYHATSLTELLLTLCGHACAFAGAKHNVELNGCVALAPAAAASALAVMLYGTASTDASQRGLDAVANSQSNVGPSFGRSRCDYDTCSAATLPAPHCMHPSTCKLGATSS